MYFCISTVFEMCYLDVFVVFGWQFLLQKERLLVIKLQNIPYTVYMLHWKILHCN